MPTPARALAPEDSRLVTNGLDPIRGDALFAGGPRPVHGALCALVLGRLSMVSLARRFESGESCVLRRIFGRWRGSERGFFVPRSPSRRGLENLRHGVCHSWTFRRTSRGLHRLAAVSRS
jgi:hypothetical protein